MVFIFINDSLPTFKFYPAPLTLVLAPAKKLLLALHHPLWGQTSVND